MRLERETHPTIPRQERLVRRHTTYFPEQYVWDNIFSQREDGSILAYHMQLPRTPERKSIQDCADDSTIGMAVSKDGMRTWKNAGTAIDVGPEGSWDYAAIWSGSVLDRPGKGYAMLYTGRPDKATWEQKIGLATSPDGLQWQKYEGNPILPADNRWYSMDNTPREEIHFPAWRDPYLFKNPKTGEVYATISANVHKTTDTNYTAAIALARATSPDLTSWEVLPPLVDGTGKYGQMEASQMLFHNGRWYLFFHTWASYMSPEHKSQQGITGGGIQCYVSETDDVQSAYHPVNNGTGVVSSGAENAFGIYTAKIIKQIDEKDYIAMGWINTDTKGEFVGGFSQPFLLTVDGDRVTKKTLTWIRRLSLLLQEMRERKKDRNK